MERYNLVITKPNSPEIIEYFLKTIAMTCFLIRVYSIMGYDVEVTKWKSH